MAGKIFLTAIALLVPLVMVCKAFDYDDLPEWISGSVAFGIILCIGVAVVSAIVAIWA